MPERKMLPPRLTPLPKPLAHLNWEAIALTLLVKVSLLGFGAIAYQILANQALPGWYAGLEIWNRWDAPHYVNIAHHGYQAEGELRRLLVFFPLFPALVSLVSWVTREYVLSGFLVSGVASVLAAVLLQDLVQLDESKATARHALWFFLIFPTSYFLHIGYTESLFLALTLGCILAARRQQWMLAGVLGLLANLSRSSGIVLIPVLLVEAAQQFWQTRQLQRGWGWIGIVPLGFLIYLLCNYLTTGNPFEFLIHQREYWHKSLTWPWLGWQQRLGEIPTSEPWHYQMVVVQELIFVGLGAIATLWSWLRLRPSYAIWMTGNWLLFTSTQHILSVPRYTLVMFPLFILFARLAHTRLGYAALTLWSLLFLALFVSLFVQGRWAF